MKFAENNIIISLSAMLGFTQIYNTSLTIILNFLLLFKAADKKYCIAVDEKSTEIFYKDKDFSGVVYSLSSKDIDFYKNGKKISEEEKAELKK